MTVKHYNPEDVWRAFKNGKDDEILLAENTEYGISISITSDDDNDVLPVIVVSADDLLVFEEAVVSQDDCTQTVKKAFDEFLNDQRVIQHFLGTEEKADANSKNGAGFVEEESIDDLEQDMLDREDELREALTDFLLIVTDGCYVDDEDVVDDCLDHFLEYLARKWGYESIRRPMILEDEKGEEFFEEYPYEIMEYDDPDDPLYK